MVNKSDLRRLCSDIENCGGIAQLMRGGLLSKWVELVNPTAVISLLDECDENEGAMQVWRRRTAQVEAERDAALAELAELREELAGVKNVSIETAKAMKRLVMYARTSGGTAGPDAGLMDACEQAEKMLSIGGIGRAYMEGADAAMSQEANHA